MIRIYEDGQDPLVTNTDSLRLALARLRRRVSERKPVTYPIMALSKRVPSRNKYVKAKDRFCEFRPSLSPLNPYVTVVLVNGAGTRLKKQLATPQHALGQNKHFATMWEHLRTELLEDHGYRLPPHRKRAKSPLQRQNENSGFTN